MLNRFLLTRQSEQRFFLPTLLAGLLLTLFTGLPSQTLADLVKIETDTGFHSVYVFPQPEESTIRVSATVLAGEVDVEGPEGLSHYLEHLMYLHADKAEENAVHARQGNAWVNGIITNYFNIGEADELDAMMDFIARLFSKPQLQLNFMLRERSVVAREYDVGVSENPDARAYMATRKYLFDNASVSRSVIGTLESIGKLSIESAVSFHQNFYQPANTVLFISGPVNINRIKLLVNTKFSQLAAGKLHEQEWRSQSVRGELDKIYTFKDSQANYERIIYMSLSDWAGSQDAKQKHYTLLTLRNILDSALPGGIAVPLRTENFIVRSFELDLSQLLSEQIELTLFAVPDQGISLQEVEQAIRSTLADIAATGIPAATLERVRKRMLQTAKRKSENSGDAYFRLHESLTAGLEPDTASQQIERIENVTLADINSLMKALATPPRRAVAFLEPDKKDEGK